MKYLFLIFPLVLLIILGSQENTIYANRNIPKLFKEVNVGDSLDHALDTLGPPIESSVFRRGDGSYQVETSEGADRRYLAEHMNDENVIVMLVYSKRMPNREVYVEYSMHLKGGKVFRVGRGEVID